MEEFPKGRFFGTTHTYLGQEANAVGVLSHLAAEDIVTSNHRCHGHFLAYGGEPRALFAELMGRSTGVCGGRGGSQHLHWRNFYSSGVLGGMLPLTAGMALAEKVQGRNAIAVAFLGDGALGEGVLYESLNMASLWKAPILFVVENNHIAQTTAIELNLAGDICERFSAFGILSARLDTSDVLEILSRAQELLESVRSQNQPHALVLDTHRFGPHSKGDDTRPPDVIRRIQQDRDPIKIHGARLDTKIRAEIEMQVEAEVSQAFERALHDPFPLIESHEDAPRQPQIASGEH